MGIRKILGAGDYGIFRLLTRELTYIVVLAMTGTIKKISSIGYEDCETYGYDPATGTYYGLKASAFRKLLADHRMITTSGTTTLQSFSINLRML